ncbi:MAG: ImpA family type VI secretion system protein [Paracoccaceae bacterium]
MADLQAFLEPIAGPDPAGAELRNDPRFHELERLLDPAGRERRAENLKGGGTGAAAIDWSTLLDKCAELSSEGRDVRLLMLAVRALAAQDGFDGLAQGLRLLAETAQRHWDHLHPALRENPSKQQAALRRLNAFKQVENNENGLLSDLEFNIAAQAKGMGFASGSDMAFASLTPASLLAERNDAMSDKDRTEFIAQHEARVNRVMGVLRVIAAERPDDLAALAEGVRSARAALGELEAALDAHVMENGVGVRFATLAKFLTRIDTTLAPHLPAGGPAMTEEAPMPEAMPGAESGAEPAAIPAAGAEGAVRMAVAPVQAGLPARITTRAEVERALDLIIDYYEKIEPSSPIPHLAKRMRKMVPMNFLQLMAELAPSGMKDFQGLVGALEEKAK